MALSENQSGSLAHQILFGFDAFCGEIFWVSVLQSIEQTLLIIFL